MEKPCELCGQPAGMSVAILMPTFGEFVTGALCLACWASLGDDLDVAAALLKHRASERGLALPVNDLAVLLSLFVPEAEAPA